MRKMIRILAALLALAFAPFAVALDLPPPQEALGGLELTEASSDYMGDYEEPMQTHKRGPAFDVAVNPGAPPRASPIVR